MPMIKTLGNFIQLVKSTPNRISYYKMGTFSKVRDYVSPKVVRVSYLFERYMEVL